MRQVAPGRARRRARSLRCEVLVGRSVCYKCRGDDRGSHLTRAECAGNNTAHSARRVLTAHSARRRSASVHGFRAPPPTRCFQGRTSRLQRTVSLVGPMSSGIVPEA